MIIDSGIRLLLLQLSINSRVVLIATTSLAIVTNTRDLEAETELGVVSMLVAYFLDWSSSYEAF